MCNRQNDFQPDTFLQCVQPSLQQIVSLMMMKKWSNRIVFIVVAAIATSASDALVLGGGATKTKKPPRIGKVTAGPLEISSLGCGTWSWGNRLLFDYDPSQDEGIYEAYRVIRNAGVTIFDTAGKKIHNFVQNLSL
jgi:hypothetical protein